MDNKKLTADFDQAFKEVKTTAQQDKQQLAAIEAKKAKLENTNNNYLNNANALLNACWDISTSEAECKKIWQNVREKNPQLNLPEMVGASATQSSTQFPSNAGMLFAPPPSSGAKKRPMPAVIVNTSVPNNNHSCSEKTDSSSTSMLPQIPVMY